MGINKDQVQGRNGQIQGKVKESIGKVVGDKDLETKGKMQKHLGGAQASVGDVKQDIKQSVKTP